jgi:hypothetical protein
MIFLSITKSISFPLDAENYPVLEPISIIFSINTSFEGVGIMLVIINYYNKVVLQLHILAYILLVEVGELRDLAVKE